MSRQNSSQPGKVEDTVLGYQIHHYDKVSSTNEVAKEIAKNTEKEKIVVLAETQTSGKGRLGRPWISPEGGLWLSIILRPRLKPKEALKLTFITASAVAKTIRSMYGLKAEVKWPNDVLVERRKVCGILTETSIKGNVVDFAVVGVGLNANVDLGTFPSNIKDYATSLKQELKHEIGRSAWLKSFLQNFEHRYRRLHEGMWRVLLEEWKNLATFLGEEVEVTDDELLMGKALDVEDDGSLIVRLGDGVLKRIITGDVKVRRQP